MERTSTNGLENTLRQIYYSKRERNPAFSLRAFARLLKIQPASLSEILRSKRNVSKAYAQKLLARLAVDELEVAGILSGMPQNAKPTGPHYRELSLDEYHLVSQWYHFAILSLAKIPGFDGKPASIAKRLGISEANAKHAVKRLLRMGFLERPRLSGTPWKTTDVSAPDGVTNSMLRNAHAKNLDLAHESLFRDGIERRDFTAITMAIDPADLPKVRRRIRKFRDTTSTLLESGKPKDVYKLCIQLFPITQQTEKTHG